MLMTRDRYGAMSRRRKRLREEVGHALGRLEEVDGVARRRRVDDDQVVAARRCGSRTAAPWRCSRGSARTGRRCSGRAGWRGSRRAVVVVGRVALHQVVPRLLGVEHGRPQLAARRDAGRRRTPRAGTGVSTLPNPSRPRALASRRAGSTVSTSTLPPRCAAAMAAAAAAVVVLPTPPEPQAIDDLLGREQLLDRAGAAPVRSLRPSVAQLRGRAPRPPAGSPACRGCGRTGTARRAAAGRAGSPSRSRSRCSARVRRSVTASSAAVERSAPRRRRRRRPAPRPARARAGARRPPPRPRPNSSGSTRLTTTAARSTSVSSLEPARPARSSR